MALKPVKKQKQKQTAIELANGNFQGYSVSPTLEKLN